MLHIVVNPVTGGGKGKKIAKRMESILKGTGTEYSFYCPHDVDGLAGIISLLTEKEPADGGYTDIVLVAGDGTMNAAVNAIRDFEHTRIALIPSGSGNDLGRGLDLPSGLRPLVDRILKRETVRSIDIGLAEVNGQKRLFNISSGLGFDAETCYHVEQSRMKKFLNRLGMGKLIYIAVAIKLIIKNETFRCEIELPGGEKKVYEECLFAVGMNHKYEGGGFMFCPEASDTDGMLDFCAVDGVGPGKFMMMFPTALSGKHVKYEEIDIFRSREAVIKVESGRNIHTDGEADLRSDTLKLSVYDKKLKLLI